MTKRVLMDEIALLRRTLNELLAAYERESACLIDNREPERYRENAQDLVERVKAVLDE